ncbi:MAG: ABC transporter substrate-binding protein [Chloroflexi bacterium]|nr:ABC transporter substrate-binding protein [Chloroflexota bacterium]
MIKIIRSKALLVSVLAAILVFAGCTGGPKPTPAIPGPGTTPTTTQPTTASPTGQPANDAPRPRAKGAYISGTSAGDAETLNWILAADSASFGYVGNTMDSLATYDNQFNVQLRHLARPIQVSDDGLVYTITIRDDLKWTGGTRVTAEDYVYTLKNLMFSDWLNYTYKSDWQEEVDGKEVFVEPKVVNDTTFTITRKTVAPEFADNALYSLTPYPRHIAQKYEGNVKAFTEAEEFNKLTYTGNLGTYKFVDWIRNDKFVADRNPDFYLGQKDGSPYFEKTTIKLFGSPAARMGALEAGDITSTGIDPPQVAKFKKLPSVNVYTTPTTGYLMLSFNLRANGWEGLKDKSVRQALAMSISKDTLIQSILLGFGEPAFSFIPRPSPWYSDAGLSKYGVEPLYDKNKAKQMLAAAGFGAKKDDNTFEVKAKDGKQLKLTIATNSGNKERESVAFLVKQELSDLGIEVELKLVPWPTLLGKYLRNKVPGADQQPQFNNGAKAVSEEPWDLMVMGFSTNPVSPSGQEVFFNTDGGLNFNGFSNPAVDALFKRAKSAEAIKPENRKAIYAELSRIMSEEMPVDFLAFQAANSGFQKNVKGIEPGINMGWNGHLWFFAD